MTVHPIASTEADAHAVSAVEQHHAQLAAALAARVQSVLRAARNGAEAETRSAAQDLVAWCRAELIPHAVAEETTLYAAAQRRAEGRLLVDGMLTEHAVIIGLVESIAAADDPVTSAADARALSVVFDNHLEKENTLVLPLLVSAADVSVADLLGGMHELLGGEAQHEPGHGHGPDERTEHRGHTCGCGEVDPDGFPELDARVVPHAIRHATIFGALDGIRPGSGLILVAPHDPKPLLAQIEQRQPGAFQVAYLEQGPERWRLAFTRQNG
ncbi:hypothetical protein GCM10009841_29180 [Microlunatus panaciterrae]|uniref:Uncharacterized protein (DUF2249 family) n=1 Tax=Microlunatus panaciterrae TaxID=400768 RepID=A0ABS2REZ4_9ACTN|nr:DUF2249 domain-containing protein [Microlunatus panaciterrae]MBM7797578.1 uncharacterized protein (DUF2249 family) [Microlunatus panaciterrae]